MKVDVRIVYISENLRIYQIWKIPSEIKMKYK